MDNRPFFSESEEMRTPNGDYIQLCVIHELWPLELGRRPAITVVGGFAVCREHLEPVSTALRRGDSVADILKAIKQRPFSSGY